MGKRQNQVSEKDQLTVSRKSIPIDLLILIFSRLPVKSIARCRCVSKQWRSILRLRYFTDLFLRISLTRLCLLFTFNLNGTWHFFSVPQHDQNSSLLTPDRHMKTFPGKDGVHRMSGNPLGGLLCGGPFICNPSTGQYRTLPKVTSTRDDEVTSFLGYDPIDKVFKVLRMQSYSYRVRVLTLGTAGLSWSRIKCSIPHVALVGICINGVLYYLGLGKGYESQYMLVTFDFRLEIFKFTNVDLMILVSSLINFKGKLGLVLPGDGRAPGHYDKFCTRLELWVLDDAENLNWSKHVYELPSSWENLVGDNWLSVIGMTDTDDIVFSSYYDGDDPFYIFYYNVVKNTIARVEINFGMEFPKGRHIMHSFINHVQDVKLIEELRS